MMGIAVRGVKAPIHELCVMAQRGEIPGEEVAQLIAKYKPMVSVDKAKTLEAMLGALRQDARGIDDIGVRASAFALVATLSHNINDVDTAVTTIIQCGEGDETKASHLAAVVRTLAEAKKISEAKRVTGVIAKLSKGWHAYALLHIAEFSEEKKDLDNAHDFIENKITRGSDRQSELLSEFEQVEDILLSGKPRATPSVSEKKNLLADVLGAFALLHNVQSVHVVHSVLPHISSASARFHIREALYRALSKATK